MGWVVLTIIVGVALALAVAFYGYAKRRHAADIATEEARKAAATEAGQPYSPRYDPDETDFGSVARVAKWAVYGLAFVLVLETFVFSFTIVSTKNVGIVTEFGAVTGHLSNGPHLVAPWATVTEMDAAIQTDSYTSKKDDSGPCLSVRIGNQQTACVSVSIRWRIEPDQADSLFQNYRTFDHVRDSLVTRELTQAVNQQFSNYNPLNSVATTNPGDKRNPPLNVIATLVTSQMRREIGSEGIDVLNTIIPLVTFDPQTQNRINQLQQQFALTRIAQQEKITNEAQALANKALAASVNTSPNVLVAQCFTILSEMVKQGQNVPPAFSCWPGQRTGVGVIAGGK
jgi:hypothetical protein